MLQIERFPIQISKYYYLDINTYFMYEQSVTLEFLSASSNRHIFRYSQKNILPFVNEKQQQRQLIIAKRGKG